MNAIILYELISYLSRKELFKTMPYGKPLYNVYTPVMFEWTDREGNKYLKHGMVMIVDAYGTIEQSQYASYDISVPSDDFTWYKHIIEPNVSFDDTEEAISYDDYEKAWEEREKRINNSY